MVDFPNISLLAQNDDNLGVVGKYSAVFNCPKKTDNINFWTRIA